MVVSYAAVVVIHDEILNDRFLPKADLGLKSLTGWFEPIDCLSAYFDLRASEY